MLGCKIQAYTVVSNFSINALLSEGRLGELPSFAFVESTERTCVNERARGRYDREQV